MSSSDAGCRRHPIEPLRHRGLKEAAVAMYGEIITLNDVFRAASRAATRLDWSRVDKRASCSTFLFGRRNIKVKELHVPRIGRCYLGRLGALFDSDGRRLDIAALDLMTKYDLLMTLLRTA